MKWFKHFSSASNDEFLEGIIEDFGLEGYARWWLILETIASQMDKTDKCSVTYSWVKWQTILKGKRNKLETFLERLENESKINTKQIDNKLEISCPKLLKLRDNYTKDLQEPSKKLSGKLPSKEVEVEVEVEVDKPKEIQVAKAPKFDFRKNLIVQGVEEDVADTWLAVRKKKKASNSELAFNAVRREAIKANISMNNAILMCCENSWSGFKAEWLKNEQAKQQPGSEDFIGKHTNNDWAEGL